MSLFAIFAIAAVVAVSAALPGNGAIRVPSENLREEKAPMEKINHDLDLKAEEDDAGKIFQQLYRKHSKEPARQRPILHAGRCVLLVAFCKIVKDCCREESSENINLYRGFQNTSGLVWNLQN